MIRITNEIIRIGTKSYPTRSILSFEKTDRMETFRIPIEQSRDQRRRKRWKNFKQMAIVWGSVGFILLFGWWYAFSVAGLISDAGTIVTILLIWPTYIWVLWAGSVIAELWSVIAGYEGEHLELGEQRIHSYAVRLRLPSEFAEIRTYDEGFRDRVYDTIEKAITHSARVNYTVNVEKQEIINNNQTHIDRSVTHNYDYSINFNRYEGLSEEQLRFLSTEFNGALSRLAQDLQREGDDELRQQLDELVSTLKASSEKPEDATRLKKSWVRFKGLCEAYDLSTSALEMVGTIGKGVSIVVGLVT